MILLQRLLNFFGNDIVLSVQFMPGRAIRVTFENEPFAANVVRESSVSIGLSRGVGLDRRMF